MGPTGACPPAPLQSQPSSPTGVSLPLPQQTGPQVSTWLQPDQHVTSPGFWAWGCRASSRTVLLLWGKLLPISHSERFKGSEGRGARGVRGKVALTREPCSVVPEMSPLSRSFYTLIFNPTQGSLSLRLLHLA